MCEVCSSSCSPKKLRNWAGIIRRSSNDQSHVPLETTPQLALPIFLGCTESSQAKTLNLLFRQLTSNLFQSSVKIFDARIEIFLDSSISTLQILTCRLSGPVVDLDLDLQRSGNILGSMELQISIVRCFPENCLSLCVPT